MPWKKDEPRNFVVGTSVTAAEKQFLEDFAEAYGFRSASGAAHYLTGATIRMVVMGQLTAAASFACDLESRWKANGGRTGAKRPSISETAFPQPA